MQLTNGTELKRGDYRILGILGQGGFGITYLALQVKLNRKVAIKEFFMKDLCNRDNDGSHVSVGSVGSKDLVERFKQKFLKEARSIASLEHKHIVPIIDVFEENGTAYYVMKYFGGGSLSACTALSEEKALRYIRQIASAIGFIHGRHMMHLDIKPGNILLDSEDNAIVIDFGLAKQYDEAGHQTSTTPVGISHGYAPLEQYKAGGVSSFSPATDIYSLGATLYRLLTDNRPADAMDLVSAPFPACPANVSASTWNAVKSAMQPAIASRPQSVEEFLELVESGEMKDERAKSKDETSLSMGAGQNAANGNAAVEENEIEVEVVETPSVAPEPAPRPQPEENQKKNKFLWIIILLAIILGTAGGFVFFGNNGSTEIKDYTKVMDSAESNIERTAIITDSTKQNGTPSAKKDTPQAAIKTHVKKRQKDITAAEAFSKGWNACNNKNYQEGTKWYRIAAEKGHAGAQCNLGFNYENGFGVSQSYNEAVKWYRKAAEQGNIWAQHNLGYCYYYGNGVSQSYTNAVKWFRKAAEQGHADSQYVLALCYEYAQGVPQSWSEAVKWFRRAAEQGNANAQASLGARYENGEGVPKSISEAVYWYRKAAAQGQQNAKNFLKRLGY